jgi:regulatory protein
MKRPPGSCHDKALQLLSQRPHFKQELARKLSLRGFDRESIENTLARLVEEKYLDDDSFALDWAAGALRRRGLGVSGVRRELKKRGLEDEVIAGVLEDSFPEGDSELAMEVGRRWRARGGRRREALARHLERKGFSESSIWKVLEDFEDAGSE